MQERYSSLDYKLMGEMQRVWELREVARTDANAVLNNARQWDDEEIKADIDKQRAAGFRALQLIT